MKQAIKSLAATAALVCGVGLLSSPTPAQAFFVSEGYFLGNADAAMGAALGEYFSYGKEHAYKREDGANSKVFLNEVDPVVTHTFWSFPKKAGYEIAAPNGTDLRGWKLLIYEGGKQSRRAHLIATYPLEDFSNGGIFTDQQQGWGFAQLFSQNTAEIPYDKDLRASLPVWSHFSNVQGNYVIVDNNDQVIQALAYHDEALLTDGPAKGYVTTSIRGLSRHHRNGKGEEGYGSWRLNNVFLEPDSTYGSLKRAAIGGYPGLDVTADDLVQWWTPRQSRLVLSSGNPSPSQFGKINFAPENTPSFSELFGSEVLECGSWKEKHERYYGPGFCLPGIADGGYLFDSDNDAHSQMPSLPNHYNLTVGSEVAIKITDDNWAKTHLTVIGLPVGTDYNPSMAATLPTTQHIKGLPNGFTYNPQTGVLAGKVTENMNLRVVVASNNLQPNNDGFVPNGHNGHGITYRTFFMRTANRPPVITTDPAPLVQGITNTSTVQVTDPDGDKIGKVTLTGPGGSPLPPGLSFDATDSNTPLIKIDATTPVGEYPLVITAWDKPEVGPAPVTPLSTQQPYTLVVRANRPPVITLPTISVEEGIGATFDATVNDPDGDAIATATVTTPDGKPIPGVTFDVSNPAKPKIVLGPDTTQGTYTFTLTVDDAHGPALQGRGVASGTITINPSTVITVPTLTAPYRAKKSVLISVTGGTPGALELIPGKDAVPGGLNIVTHKGALRLQTNGFTEIGIYEIAIHNDATKKSVPVKVVITEGSVVPYPVVQDYSILAGRQATLPFTIHSVGQTRLTMTLMDPAMHSLPADRYNHAFSLDTTNMTRPVIRVAQHAKPGRYIIKLTANDVAQPTIRGEALMRVTVLSNTEQPVITMNTHTVKRSKHMPVSIQLKVSAANQGYIKASLANRTQVPRGIRVQSMAINGTARHSLVVSSLVEEGTYPVTIEVRNSFGVTSVKSYMVTVTKNTVEVRTK